MKKAMSVMLVCFLMSSLAYAAKEDRTAAQTARKEKVRSHMMQQRSENKAVRESLKGRSKEEKKAAWKEHKTKQHAENMALRKEMFEENKARLQAKLDKNKKLSAAQKAEMMKMFEENHSAKMEYRKGQYQKNVDFMSKIANDKNMSQAEKKAAIKEYFAKQKEENKKRVEEMKAKNKAARQKLKEKKAAEAK